MFSDSPKYKYQKMKSLSAIIFYLIIISYSQQGKAQNAKSPIDCFIEQKMNELGMVGVGAAVFVNKKLVWTQGYGYADKDNKVSFTPNTIMNIGSISKTITGACLMHAVEEKRLSLDEDINNYLPFKVINPFSPKEIITLRNLATHTSGITDQQPLYDSSYFYGGDSPEQLGDFLRNYFTQNGKYYKKENFLDSKPGSYYKYSNIGAGLAGFIVETVTGEKLNEYSMRYIFKPLKMDNTGWLLSEIKLNNHSKLYSKLGDTIKPIKLYGFPTYPDGGVRTSVTDLSKFFMCLLNGGELYGARILKKELVKEMISPQFTLSKSPDNIDLGKDNSGIFWSIRDNGTKVGHNGSDPGVNTMMRYDPSKQVGVIFFMNTELSEVEMKKFMTVYDELWEYALTLKCKNRSF